MQKLDELELKEKKNECAGTDASGKSTELEQTKSPSKAVPKAGQQQQECRIRYVQETLEKSVPLEPPSHGRGGGGRSGWCQGSGMGHRSLTGLSYMSCRSGKKQRSPKGHGTVSPVVDIGRGEPEDNGKDEGRAGEHK